jgi:hypothetical protein
MKIPQQVKITTPHIDTGTAIFAASDNPTINVEFPVLLVESVSFD